MTVPDGRYGIEQNLSFVVRKGGTSRIFVFRYQMGGRRRDMSLGAPPNVTITAAKEQAATYRALIARGFDPKEARDQAVAEASKRVQTLGGFLEYAFEEMLQLRKPKSARNFIRDKKAIQNHICPKLGNVPLDKITPYDLAEALRPIWGRAIADATRGALEGVFTIAMRDGHVDTNPAVWRGGLSAWLPPSTKTEHKRGHMGAPTIAELQIVLETCLSMNPRISRSPLAIVFGALTATRAQEYYFAKSTEIDFDEAVWKVPAERRKDGRQEVFRVPLSEQAITLVKATLSISPKLFCRAHYTPGAHHNAIARIYRRIRGDRDFTAHGVRSTFSSWAAENSVDWAVRETCLMHKTESAVGAAYQRSDLLEQRRDVMQRWADVILPMDVLEAALTKAGVSTDPKVSGL